MGSSSIGLGHRVRRLVRRPPHLSVPAKISLTGELAPPPDPLLSVVLAAYQVEDYLAECLDSLLAQSYHRLEIVLVDDGSTDRTGAIARAYAERDPRVVVVAQPNAGLGAARNTGLAHATGELVTFADSDDTVPPQAYRRMVSSLQRSGSDFVVGALVRHEGGVERMRPWVKRVHARRRLGVTLDDVPGVLANVVACTKVFRRDFLDRIALGFPEGVRYEDQVPITRAYLEARSFDVLPDVVYTWRKRDDKSSISQQKGEIRDLLDRLAAQQQVADLLQVSASGPVLRSWYVKTFRHDFFAYLRVAADADDEYWGLLQERIVSIAQQAPADLDDDVELRVRLAVWLGRHGHRRALRAFVREPGFLTSNFPVVARDGHLHAQIRCLEGHPEQPPDRLLRIHEVDLRLTTRLEALGWHDRPVLSVRFLAALSYVDPERHEVETVLRLVGPEGTSFPDLPARVAPDPLGNLTARRAYEDHSRSTVVADIDLAALVRAGEERPVVRWELRGRASADAMSAEGALDDRRESGSAVLARAALVDGALVSSRWSERRGLLLEVRREYVAAAGVTYRDGCFELEVHAPGLSRASQVHVGPTAVPATIRATARPDVWAVRIASAGIPADLSGRVRVTADGLEQHLLVVAGDLDPVSVSDGRSCLRATVDGLLTLARDLPALMVDNVEIDGRTARLTGRVHAVSGGTLALRGPRAQSAPYGIDVVDGTFSVDVGLEHLPPGQDRTVLPANLYSVVAEHDGERLRVLSGRLFQGPQPWETRAGWSVETTADERLQLRRSRHVDREAPSRLVQERLRSNVYAGAVAGARRDLVFLECFGGTGTGDGPRAVCDALLAEGAGLDLVWSVDDASVAPVPGTRAVIRHSAEWFEAVGSARLLVTNNTLPGTVRKAPGQIHVQTWHGTPLKRIGTDIAHQRMSTDHYLRLLLQEANRWDYLVSSSPYCTKTFRRAFDFDGQVLEIGRPSNDLLLRDDARQVRRRVRASLGIPEDQTVLLYAPTWRDNAWSGGGWEKVLHLDTDQVTATRQDVTVLVRGHANTTGRAHVPRTDRVIDVTAYPDVAPLYLAADVLVTDYAAAMFDFALTDKPMILLAPDLESYRDRIRGLYLDLADIAPGPVVSSTAAVLDALQDDLFAVARKQLRDVYAPWDDGSATQRLLDAVLPQALRG